MKKPAHLYGVYHMDLASWKFYLSNEAARGFQGQGENRFGPVVFPFWNAWDQFRVEANADGVREPSEEEFLRVLQGEEIDFNEDEVRLEPSEAYFEDVGEALLWLRASGLYIWNHMANHAAKLGFEIEDYDYYDGFLNRIGAILDDYFEDIENYERILENLYDGVDDMVFNEEDLDE